MGRPLSRPAPLFATALTSITTINWHSETNMENKSYSSLRFYKCSSPQYGGALGVFGNLYLLDVVGMVVVVLVVVIML